MRCSKQAWKIQFLLRQRCRSFTLYNAHVYVYVRAIDIHKILRHKCATSPLNSYFDSKDPRATTRDLSRNENSFPAGFSYLAYKSPSVFSLLPSLPLLSPSSPPSLRIDPERFELFQSGPVKYAIVTFVKNKNRELKLSRNYWQLYEKCKKKLWQVSLPLVVAQKKQIPPIFLYTICLNYVNLIKIHLRITHVTSIILHYIDIMYE